MKERRSEGRFIHGEAALTRPEDATGWRSAVPSLYPVTVGDKTVGIRTAEFEVTNDDEAGVVNAVANSTFGKAFDVLYDIVAATKR